MVVDRSLFWKGRRVLITGHTGFKGSWLSIWLASLGAEVHGLALAPDTDPSLYLGARVDDVVESGLGDIRDLDVVLAAVRSAPPEVVFHMAAQPLVRLSYESPLETYATNVMGTAHVLEAVRRVGGVAAVVVVTSDKCYENREWHWAYREDEALGGSDPYSSSKGCTELVAAAYRRSFLAEEGTRLATVRSGNVIGGGDWARDRLIPDILRSFERGEKVVIRNPDAVRPWQHVLEPLSGYLTVAERLLGFDGASFAEAWNFGPVDSDARPVRWIVEAMARRWGEGANWEPDGGRNPEEARLLKLDSSKARARLGWSSVWGLGEALDRIVDWNRARLAGRNYRDLCLEQIRIHTEASNLLDMRGV